MCLAVYHTKGFVQDTPCHTTMPGPGPALKAHGRHARQPTSTQHLLRALPQGRNQRVGRAVPDDHARTVSEGWGMISGPGARRPLWVERVTPVTFT